jgi:hypothetical protein
MLFYIFLFVTGFPLIKYRKYVHTFLKILYWYTVQKCIDFILNHTVIHQRGEYTELIYFFNRKQYRMILKQKKGPNPILQISHNDIDVTDDILPYFGPEMNWHHFIFNPLFWGYDHLVFQLSDGNEVVFNSTEPIIF